MTGNFLWSSRRLGKKAMIAENGIEPATMHPFLAFVPMSWVMNLPKLFYLSAAILLFGAAELAYGAITGSTFFMVFGAPQLSWEDLARYSGGEETRETDSPSLDRDQAIDNLATVFCS